MTNKGDFSTTPGAVVCQNTVNLPPQYCHHFCPCATYCEPGCALDCTTKHGDEFRTQHGITEEEYERTEQAHDKTMAEILADYRADRTTEAQALAELEQFNQRDAARRAS